MPLRLRALPERSPSRSSPTRTTHDTVTHARSAWRTLCRRIYEWARIYEIVFVLLVFIREFELLFDRSGFTPGGSRCLRARHSSAMERSQKTCTVLSRSSTSFIARASILRASGTTPRF